MHHGQGQYPLVAIEVDASADKDQVAKDVYKECLEKLEERGRPVAVVCVNEIPLTGVGKNDYRQLEKDFKYFDYEAWGKNF